MSAHRLFCTLQTLLSVIGRRKERPYSSVCSVIEKLSDLYIECNGKEELIYYTKVNPVFNKLVKQISRKIIPIISIKEEIRLPNPDDIFLMLPPESRQYIGYREKKGLLITYSLTDLQVIDDICNKHFRPYSLLTDDQKKNLKAHDEEYEDIKSWKEVFDKLSPTPINSAIIIDNYIFHDDSNKLQYSLYNIIKSLVPDGLQIPFHLTIFVYNKDGELKEDKMKCIVEDIHALKLGSDIKVSIIAHTNGFETHDRMILTNYHLMTSGRGFGVIDCKGVYKPAQGVVYSTFHNIDNLMSYTSIKHQHSQILDWLKDIYIDHKGMNALYAFEVGDTFNNRLISN